MLKDAHLVLLLNKVRSHPRYCPTCPFLYLILTPSNLYRRTYSRRNSPLGYKSANSTYPTCNPHTAHPLQPRISSPVKGVLYSRNVYDFSITSYGDRPNVYETAASYFKSHFQQVHKKKDVSHRVLWVVSITSPPVSPLMAEPALLTIWFYSHHHSCRVCSTTRVC